MASFWIAVGVTKPMSVTALSRSAGRPRSAKVVSVSPGSSASSPESRKGAWPSTSSSTVWVSPSSASSPESSSGSASGTSRSTSSSSSSCSTSSGSSGESEEAGEAKSSGEPGEEWGTARGSARSVCSVCSSAAAGSWPAVSALKRASRLRGADALVSLLMELSQIWPLKYLWGRRGVWGRAGCAPLLPHHPPHSPRTGSQVPWDWWLTGCTHRLTGVLPGKFLAAPNGVGYGSLLPMRLADADTRRTPARTTSHGEVSLDPQQLAAGGQRSQRGRPRGPPCPRPAGSAGRPPAWAAVRRAPVLYGSGRRPQGAMVWGTTPGATQAAPRGRGRPCARYCERSGPVLARRRCARVGKVGTVGRCVPLRANVVTRNVHLLPTPRFPSSKGCR